MNIAVTIMACGLMAVTAVYCARLLAMARDLRARCQRLEDEAAAFSGASACIWRVVEVLARAAYRNERVAQVLMEEIPQAELDDFFGTGRRREMVAEDL